MTRRIARMSPPFKEFTFHELELRLGHSNLSCLNGERLPAAEHVLGAGGAREHWQHPLVFPPARLRSPSPGRCAGPNCCAPALQRLAGGCRGGVALAAAGRCHLRHCQRRWRRRWRPRWPRGSREAERPPPGAGAAGLPLARRSRVPSAAPLPATL